MYSAMNPAAAAAAAAAARHPVSPALPVYLMSSLLGEEKFKFIFLKN